MDTTTTNNQVVNKAGIEPIPSDRYVISTAQVVQYLQDKLGFGFGFDFTRWVGAVPDNSYVRMRCVFQSSDIIMAANDTDYVTRILNKNSAAIVFKDTVMDVLKPYMYPKIDESLAQDQEALKRMYQMGLFGERLGEVARYSELDYCEQKGVWRLYLAPEKIIVDMLSDPKTGKPNGDLSIITVLGTSSESIRWEVSVSRKTNVLANTDLSVEAVYRS